MPAIDVVPRLKFASRNRVALMLTTLVAGFLVILSVGSSVAVYHYIHLAEAREEALGRAEKARALAAEARREADRRASEAREVVDFLINDLPSWASPYMAQGEPITVREALDQADRIDCLPVRGPAARRGVGPPVDRRSVLRDRRPREGRAPPGAGRGVTDGAPRPRASGNALGSPSVCTIAEEVRAGSRCAGNQSTAL